MGVPGRAGSEGMGWIGVGRGSALFDLVRGRGEHGRGGGVEERMEGRDEELIGRLGGVVSEKNGWVLTLRGSS